MYFKIINFYKKKSQSDKRTNFEHIKMILKNSKSQLLTMHTYNLLDPIIPLVKVLKKKAD